MYFFLLFIILYLINRKEFYSIFFTFVDRIRRCANQITCRGGYLSRWRYSAARTDFYWKTTLSKYLLKKTTSQAGANGWNTGFQCVCFNNNANVVFAICVATWLYLNGVRHDFNWHNKTKARSGLTYSF